MARHIDYAALIAKLEVTDIFMAIHEGEPVLLASCMDCDTTILRAIGAEVNAAELHLAILEHDCSKPAPTVVIDDVAALDEALAAIPIVDAESPALETSEFWQQANPAVGRRIVAPSAPRVLSLSDRCDRCSAQAFVRVYFADGVLDFCAHHYNEYELTLTAAGHHLITDERAFINAKPSISAIAE